MTENPFESATANKTTEEVLATFIGKITDDAVIDPQIKAALLDALKSKQTTAQNLESILVGEDEPQ